MKSPWFETEYKKKDSISHLKVEVDGVKYHLLLNPDIGSWVVLDEDEFSRYESSGLTDVESEFLYLRNLAQESDGTEVNFEQSPPANFPSVVVMNVSLRCNMACKYCFANCEPETGGDMSEEVVKEIVKQMMTMPKIDAATFEFQGGEPLLNLEAIEQCIEYANKLKPYTDMNLKFRVESNGTLVDEKVVKLLKETGMEIGISLDGPKELNDQARVYSDGSGTFDDIWHGIELLWKNNLEMSGSVCTIGKHNVHHPREIVEFFSSYNLDFKPRPMNMLGRALNSGLVATDDEWFKCYKEMHSLSKNIKAKNFSVFIYEENVYTPMRDYICLRSPCGAGRELISVNPNGDVFPCDGFKGYPEFSLGNILEEDIVSMLKKPLAQHLRSKTWKDIPKCRTCIFRGMCGPCAYSCYGAFDDIYREDPQCVSRRRIFWFLMKEWIRGNRLRG